MAKYWFSVVAFFVVLLMAYGGWILFRWMFMDEIEAKKAARRRAKMPPCCYCERYRDDRDRCVLPERDDINDSEITKSCKAIRGTKKCRPIFSREARNDMPDNDRR